MARDNNTKFNKNEKQEINRTLTALLLFFYTIILLWVIVFKCNLNESLHVEENLSKSLWERLTYRIIPFHQLYLCIIEDHPLELIAFFFNIICLHNIILTYFDFSVKPQTKYSIYFFYKSQYCFFFDFFSIQISTLYSIGIINCQWHC